MEADLEDETGTESYMRFQFYGATKLPPPKVGSIYIPTNYEMHESTSLPHLQQQLVLSIFYILATLMGKNWAFHFNLFLKVEPIYA